MISRLLTRLRRPLSTLHERRRRRPCKTRFRLAGSAFTGRESNATNETGDINFGKFSVLANYFSNLIC